MGAHVGTSEGALVVGLSDGAELGELDGGAVLLKVKFDAVTKSEQRGVSKVKISTSSMVTESPLLSRKCPPYCPAGSVTMALAHLFKE